MIIFPHACVYLGQFGTISFHQVMIQRHNRHISFSIYICALAVADTLVLFGGKPRSWVFKHFHKFS